jgi:hypothetical protein
MTQTDGVEGALRELYHRGVYLTVEEFKARRPLVRGSATLHLDPARFVDPRMQSHFPQQSGGSRGDPTTVDIDITSIQVQSINRLLVLDSRGGVEWPRAIWSVPGASALTAVISKSSWGPIPERWFTPIAITDPSLHPRYRWSARAMRWGGLLAGVKLPLPEHVSPERPLPAALWMAQVLQSGTTPFLHVPATAAVRICRTAEEEGIDVHGAHMQVVGEPLTEARLRVIERVGVVAIPQYATMECGPIANGCEMPQHSDDLHLYSDLYALVQTSAKPGPADPLPPSALLITTLDAYPRLRLLNVSLGDTATLEQRNCGCPLHRLGWTTHLHSIRSHEKLTSGGGSFLGTAVIAILEETLPDRFGGGPTDYQLIEDEHTDGQAAIRLLVHPRLGALDEAAVARTFLEAIGGGSGAARVNGALWREAGFLRVERSEPRLNGAGKVLHLAIGERQPAER